jgi:hypothetical protein
LAHFGVDDCSEALISANCFSRSSIFFRELGAAFGVSPGASVKQLNVKNFMLYGSPKVLDSKGQIDKGNFDNLKVFAPPPEAGPPAGGDAGAQAPIPDRK